MPSASWVPQSIEEDPSIASVEVVGGVTYLIYGLSADDDPTIIEQLVDGSFTEHELTASLVDNASGAAGDRIVVQKISGDSTSAFFVFDTVTHTSASIFIAQPGVLIPVHGNAGTGPDGKLYFPPYRAVSGFESMRPIVYNPETLGILLTSFGGAWIYDSYGWAEGGGDGLLYFAPGFFPMTSGSFQNGSTLACVDVATNTVTALPRPNEGPFDAPLKATRWTAPTVDGIYLMSQYGNLYKVQSTGCTLIADLSNGGDDTYAPPTYAGGRLYSVGSSYRGDIDLFVPVLLEVTPGTDAVAVYEFPALAQEHFIPTVSFPFGGTVRAFPSGFGSFDPILQIGPGGGLRFALGSVPVMLALGDELITPALGEVS